MGGLRERGVRPAGQGQVQRVGRQGNTIEIASKPLRKYGKIAPASRTQGENVSIRKDRREDRDRILVVNQLNTHQMTLDDLLVAIGCPLCPVSSDVRPAKR